MNDKRLLKTYVWHGDDCFFVSTIERDSSAAVDPPPRFNETIAWEYDWDMKELGDQVGSSGSGPALLQHWEMVQSFFLTGK